MLRKFGNGIEIRRYEKQTRAVTTFGEVYNKESYDYAADVLLAVLSQCLMSSCMQQQSTVSPFPCWHKAVVRIDSHRRVEVCGRLRAWA